IAGVVVGIELGVEVARSEMEIQAVAGDGVGGGDADGSRTDAIILIGIAVAIAVDRNRGAVERLQYDAGESAVFESLNGRTEAQGFFFSRVFGPPSGAKPRP